MYVSAAAVVGVNKDAAEKQNEKRLTECSVSSLAQLA
jgi:hypothetical protein